MLKCSEKIYRDAAKYFSTQLFGSNYALDYLKKRGILETTALSFNLGYASNEIKGLLKYLEKKFNLYEIIASGLFKIENDTLVPYFRNRIIFPVYIDEKIFSFTSRSIGENTTVKHKHMSKTMGCLYNEAALNFPIVVVTENG